MKPFLAEPEQFIRDLDRVSAALAPSLEIESFLDDLDRVHRQVVVDGEPGFAVADQYLAELATLFGGIRAGAIKRLGGSNWLERLPTNDPLRWRVGLFETLDLGRRETAHTQTLV